jgi:ribosomal protein S18 acetylase RimI-like enzyme
MEKQIEIRRAEEKDIKKVMDLLSQVLEIHAKIRPDVFVSGTTKYTDAELLQMFEDDQNPVYVAVDEKDQVVGYAFCKLRQQPFSNNMVQFTSLFIDDLCVDTTIRGKHIGQKLFLKLYLQLAERTFGIFACSVYICCILLFSFVCTWLIRKSKIVRKFI